MTSQEELQNYSAQDDTENNADHESWKKDYTTRRNKALINLILRSVTFIAGIIFLLVTAHRDAEGYFVIDAGSRSALIGFIIMAIPYIVLFFKILFKGTSAILSDFSFTYTESSGPGGGSSDYGGNFIAMLFSKFLMIIFRVILALVVVALFILLTPVQIIYYIVILVRLKNKYQKANN